MIKICYNLNGGEIMDSIIKEIIPLIPYLVLIIGIIGNTMVATSFFNGNYKNPEATSKIMVPIIIITATTDIAMLICILKIFFY
jgi:hypothetical protein